MKFPEADRKFLNSLLMRINDLAGLEADVTTHTFYKHEMFNKVFKNYLSICQVENGVEITYKGKKATVKDYSAIAVLFRSIIETLTLYFRIFYRSRDPEDIDFQFNCWQRHGLVTRQNFGTPPPSQAQKLSVEKGLLDELTTRIKSNVRFQKFDRKQKDRFNSFGQWYFETEKKTLEEMGFDQRYSESIYSYLSSHAHTESAGLMQLWQMQANGETDSLMDIVFGQVMMTVFCFIWYYVETRDSVKVALDLETLENLRGWKIQLVPEKKDG